MRGRLHIGSRRSVGWLLAAGLLASAGWWAREPLLATAASLGPAEVPAVLGMALAVLGALVLAAELFGLSLRLFPHDPPVPRLLMLRLVVVSALLNFLPLPRAGAWGRAAYLKARHGLPLRASLLSLAMVLVVSLAVFAGVAGTLVLSEEASEAARLVAAGASVLGLAAVCSRIPWATGRAGLGSSRSARFWAWPLLRAGDLLLGATRLVLACGIVGAPLSLPEALLLASGGLLVRLIGLTPNGIGLSEAAVAALAAALTPLDSAVVAAAALLDRGVELVVVGLAAAAARPGGLIGPGHAAG